MNPITAYLQVPCSTTPSKSEWYLTDLGLLHFYFNGNEWTDRFSIREPSWWLDKREDQVVMSKEELAETITSYIEHDAEIAIPINDLMNEDGTHLTKKQYGTVLLKYLAIEIKEWICKI